ncbi:MAG: histidine phosphatase family protein [Chitinophagaceae bacterium]
MKLVLIAMLMVCTSCSHTYYVVRHAERADVAGNNDPQISDKGKERAIAVKEIVAKKKIAYIYSTNTNRTKSTAQPTADYFKLPVTTYGPRPDSAFIASVKALKKNVLIVGHSNTVDDVVNMLYGEKKVPADLSESEYNKLYIIKIKGKKMQFEEKAIYPKN